LDTFLQIKKQIDMKRVTDPQGRQADIIGNNGEQVQIRYLNGKIAWFHQSRLSIPQTNSLASDYAKLAVKLQAAYEYLERERKKAEQHSTQFAAGAFMAYGSAMEVLGNILNGE
jgi:predicted nucleotide-binding protein